MLGVDWFVGTWKYLMLICKKVRVHPVRRWDFNITKIETAAFRVDTPNILYTLYR